MAPNEEESLDFMEVKGKDILVLKHKLSGFIYVRITKEKSTREVMKFLQSYFCVFGLWSVMVALPSAAPSQNSLEVLILFTT